MFVTFAFTFAVFHFLPALPKKADKVSLSSGALLIYFAAMPMINDLTW